MIKNIKNNFTYYHTWNSFEQMLPSCWWSQKKIFGAILRSGLPQELNWITMPMSLCHHFFFPPFSVILERTPRLSASWKITAQWEELMAPCAVQCEFPLHINAIKLDLSSVKYTFLIFRKWSWTMQLVVMLMAIHLLVLTQTLKSKYQVFIYNAILTLSVPEVIHM